MSEKKGYELPVLNITVFKVEDTLTTSGVSGGIELPDHDWE